MFIIMFIMIQLLQPLIFFIFQLKKNLILF